MRYREPYTLLKRGRVWYYRVGGVGNRTQHSTGKTVKREARSYVESLMPRGRDVPTFADYAKDFFDWENSPYLKRRREQGQRRQLGEESAAHRHGIVHNHLIPRWGKLRLDEVPLGVFEDWLTDLRLSGSTKNHILYTAQLILKEAVRRRIIKHNPLEGIEPRDPRSVRRDYLREDELEKLFPRDTEEFKKIWPIPAYGVMCVLAVSGGLRSGEVRALRWRHVNWALGGVAVVAAIKYKGKEGPPKWNSCRAVRLPRRTMELLEWWRDVGSCVRTDDMDYVFPLRDRRTILWQFRKALGRAGIDATGRKLDVHALRHTYTTLMREYIEEERLMQMTGHRSVKMLDNYDQREIEKRLSRLTDLAPGIERFPI